MTLLIRRVIKFAMYSALLVTGFVLSYFVGRDNDHQLSNGIIGVPPAYADVPYSGDASGGDGSGGGDGGGGDSGGDGGCGDGDGDDGGK